MPTVVPPDAQGRTGATPERGTGHLIRSAGIVMASFILAKLLGLVREVLLARQFGLSGEMDAYDAAFNLPDLLFTLIAGGALVSVLIPVLSDYLTAGDRDGAWRLASAVANLSFLVTAVLALAAIIAADALVAQLIAPGFEPEKQRLTAGLMRLILISTALFALSGVATGVLHAHQHFTLPALSPVLYNLGIIGGLLGLVPYLGVYGLAWGVVGGAALHLLVQVPALLGHGLRYRPVLGLSDPGVRRLLLLLGPRILTLGVVKINAVVATNVASRVGEGTVAALNYGWQVMQLPETVFATAIATAVFPTLAELADRHDRQALRHVVAGTLRALLALTLPATIGMIALAQPVVRLLLERGQFTAESTRLVTAAVQGYAAGLLGHSALEIATRTFYAQHDTRTPLFVAAGAMLAHAVFSVWWGMGWGAPGLALANAAAVSLEAGGLLLIARRRLGGLEEGRFGAALVRVVGATLMMGAVLFALLRSPAGTAHPIVALGAGLLAGMVYLGAVLALGLEEGRALLAMARHRLRGLLPVPAQPGA